MRFDIHTGDVKKSATHWGGWQHDDLMAQSTRQPEHGHEQEVFIMFHELVALQHSSTMFFEAMRCMRHDRLALQIRVSSPPSGALHPVGPRTIVRNRASKFVKETDYDQAGSH